MRFVTFISIIIFAVNILTARENNEMTLTVLFDNTCLNDDCQSEWGFSCLLETNSERILFDTGLTGDILLNNFNVLKIDPENIDKIIISHMHNDHIGGMLAILKKNPNADVYVVDSADEKEIVQWQVGVNKLHKIKDVTQITNGIYSLGEMTGRAREQSIVVNVNHGIWIITGCAHPGIINIIEKAGQYFKDEPIKFVMGGFHLLREDDVTVEQTIQQFQQLGVEKAGPTHCTGDNVIQKFSDVFGDNFVQVGVGFTTTVEVN